MQNLSRKFRMRFLICFNLFNSSVKVKVFRLLKSVNDVNGNSASRGVARNRLNSKLKLIFDVSSFTCGMPAAACNDKFVKCTEVNCTTKHLVCTCRSKTPKRYRSVLKEQRKAVTDLRKNSTEVSSF